MHTHLIFGNGELAVDRGYFEETSPHVGCAFVAIFPLAESQPIGDKVERTALTSDKATWLIFKNIESIEVLEKA